MSGMECDRSSIRLHLDDGPKKMCEICHIKSSHYTCPRCNVSYCSVSCFKSTKHSGCSESFYRDCFIQEMKSQLVSTSDKLHVMKMIQKLESNSINGDSDEEEPLNERLKGINLDDSDGVWAKMTADEQTGFLESVKSGALIDEWKPWWLYHDQSLVTELGGSADANREIEASAMPSAKLQVAKLPQLLNGKTSSPLVCNNLVEVLYTYAFCCRKYNGCVADLPVEFCHDFVFGSTFLLDSITRLSTAEAIESAMDRCLDRNRSIAVSQETIQVLMDVYHILLGPQQDSVTAYARLSLAEAHTCLNSLAQSRIPGMRRSLRTQILKKLEFLYAWSEHHALQLPILAMEVLGIYKSKLSWTKDHKRHVALAQHKIITSPKLIEEISGDGN